MFEIIKYFIDIVPYLTDEKIDGSDYDLLIISSERICDYYFNVLILSPKKGK